MKYKSLQLLLIFSAFTITAQDKLPSSTGRGFGTRGQIAFTTINGSFETAEQGVNHSLDIYVLTGNENTTDISLSPNPASNSVILNINKEIRRSYRGELHNQEGLLLSMFNLTSNEITVPLDSYNTYTFTLRISEDSRIIKTFKIIKK